jgi:hypothetical protein
MAGAGGAAGPEPDVSHQPPGTTVDIYYNFSVDDYDTASTMVKAALLSAGGREFKPYHKQLFAFVFYLHKDLNLYIQCMYLVCTLYEQCLNKYVTNMEANLKCPCIYLV